MAKSIITNKLQPEDIPQLRELYRKVYPDAPLPEFGGKHQETMILRDEADPTKIVGLLHVEHAIEVRAIVTDPAYKLRAQALSHAVTAMETRIRCGDMGAYDRFYVSVPEDQAYVRKFYESDGAVTLDRRLIRYMKVL